MSAELKYNTLDEIQSIHSSLKAEFLKGRSKSVSFRKQQLSQLAHMVNDNLPRFSESLKQDLGRPEQEAFVNETAACLAEITDVYNNVEKWAKDEGVPFDLSFALMKPKIRKVPKGVVLIIGAFNYPAYLTLCPMASAIAAGNAVVVKTSELSPATAALLSELVPKYLDSSLYKIINGAIPETTKLLELKWDHILYTGSSRVARIVAAAAAKHLTPLTLELGGKSPVIVDPDFDLHLAAKRIAWGRFCNAGQTCVSPDYILIPAEAQDQFVDALSDAINSFYPEGPSESKSYGRIVNDSHFQRIQTLMDDSKGELVIGGESDAAQKYIAPTVYKDVPFEDSLMSQEIFGPIIPIVPVKDLDEAIAYVNARDHPLALYLFTSNSQIKKKVLDNTQSGALSVNETTLHLAVPGLPFGGIGESGYGQHTGKWGFDTFTHFRSTVDSPKFTEALLKNRYPPYTESKMAFMKSFMVPRLPPRGGGRRPWFRHLFAAILCVVLAAGLSSRLTLHLGAISLLYRAILRKN